MGTLPTEDYWQGPTCGDKEGGWSCGQRFPAGPCAIYMTLTLTLSFSSVLPPPPVRFPKKWHLLCGSSWSTLQTQLGEGGVTVTPSPKLILFSSFLLLAGPGPRRFSSHLEAEGVAWPSAPVKMAASLPHTRTLAVPASQRPLSLPLHWETSASSFGLFNPSAAPGLY